MFSKRDLIAILVSVVKNAFRPLLAYEILFRMIALWFLGPFSAWCLYVMVSTSNRLSISSEQIVRFIFSPVGITIVLLAGTLVATMLFLEQAGLMVITLGSFKGRPVTSAAAVNFTLKNAGLLLGVGLSKILVVIVTFLPILVFATFVYLGFFSEHSIDYYQTIRSPRFVLAVLLGGLILVGILWYYIVLFVKWLCAVPVCLFEGQGFFSALRRSRQLIEGEFWPVARVLFGWMFVMLTISVAVTFLLDWLSEAILSNVAHSLNMVLSAVAGILVLYLVTTTTITIIGISSYSILVCYLYVQLRKKKEEHVPDIGVADVTLRPSGTKQRLLVPWLLWFLVGSVLFASYAVSYSVIENLDLMDQVKVTANRGLLKGTAGNTLDAIKQAITEGADYAEVAVEESANGEIIVFRDTALINAGSVPKKNWETDSEEPQKLDAGNGSTLELRKESMYTLQQVIGSARGKIKLKIELKFNGREQRLVEGVLKILREHDFERHSIIMSRNYADLLLTKRLAGKQKVGHIVSENLGDITTLNVDVLSLRSSLVTEDLLEVAKTKGLEVHAGTVNDPRDMSFLIDLGVDNIITDHPGILIELLEQRSRLSNSERVLLMLRNWLPQ